MSKNIGLDIRIYGTAHGGIGRYSKEIFGRILKLDTENSYHLFYNQHSILAEDLSELKKFKNAKLIATSARHYSAAEQTSFLRQLNKAGLDLVHFPNFNAPYFYSKPYIATIHDMVHHKISGAKKSRLVHFWAYKKIIQNTANEANKIITVSEYSKKDIAKYLQIPEQKIEVIYEAGSLSFEIGDDQVEIVKKRYLLNRPYFLFVGVLERKKNLINLTRGFDQFIQKYKLNMDLVIVGKIDKHYPEIKHKALDIKNSDRLVFTGQVEDSELAALYKGAYAFASASLHEGFGLPGVEAMSFHLPLLVSNIPVFNEIYDNAALYFNPMDPKDIAEKMHLLARDTQFYSQIQEKSYFRAQVFNWEDAAKKTLELYGKNL